MTGSGPATANAREPPRTMSRGIGFDVGGSFTDLAMVDYDTGEWRILKVPTTLRDRAIGCIEGIDALLEDGSVAPSSVSYVAHGSTVVTNTIIERTGAKTALITTKGFRDVLEIRRQVMPERYNAYAPKPVPLVPRDRRFEVVERMLPDGTVETPLDEDGLLEIVAAITRQGVEAVAICFLHSYANPAHERRAEELVRLRFPGFVTSSHRVLNEMREYERTSSVVANAYVAPSAEGYLGRVEEGAHEVGVHAPLLMFQSNGGLAPIKQARELPISTLLSGPAAGVTAACSIAAQAGFRDFVTLDMGGTSCDVSLVKDGQPSVALEQDVSGWPVRFPRLDIHTVGAGGGSIAWVDPGGLLTVGPRSAGAYPGPAAYGLGGTDATVTDAHVVLGRIGADLRLGGRVSIDHDAAERAIADIGAKVGLEAAETAAGILDVVNATMVRAIRVISVEKGADPRGLPLIAFGGAGPLHACDLARELRLDCVVIPPTPGVLCALGLLAAELRIDGSSTRRIRLHETTADELVEALGAVEADVRESTAVRDSNIETWRPSYALGMRYVGQGFDLPVPLSHEQVQELDLDVLANTFDQVHEAICGYANPSERREVLSLRVSLHAAAGRSLETLPRTQGDGYAGGPHSTRVYFKGVGWLDCPVHTRTDLPVGTRLTGPAIVFQMDTTTVVAPDYTASVDEHHNLILRAA